MKKLQIKRYKPTSLINLIGSVQEVTRRSYNQVQGKFNIIRVFKYNDITVFLAKSDSLYLIFINNK